MSNKMPERKWSVIIPALNEENTIGAVIRVFRTHPDRPEVIVISDGSTDGTVSAAKKAGAKVIKLPQNLGKGQAMEIGVEATSAPIIFFSDADISGLNHDIIDAMLNPVLDGRYVMYIAIRGRSIYWLNRILHFFPLLGGIRVVTRELWYSVPERYRRTFIIETALNYYSHKWGRRTRFRLFGGIEQVKKELKYGFGRGFYMRLKMFAEILIVSIKLYIFDSFLSKMLKLRDAAFARNL